MKKSMLSTKQSYLMCAVGIVVLFGILMGVCESGMASTYIKGIMMTSCIAIIMTTSLNLTIGVLGQLTLGCCGFEAIGAYSAALLSKLLVANGVAMDPTLRFLLTTLAGGVVACIFGILVGIPALRLHGDYLAIITLGFGEIIRVIIQNLKVAGGMGLDKGAAESPVKPPLEEPEPKEPVRPSRPSKPKKPSKSIKPKLIIVVDPGHGGEDPGAIGRGRNREKTVVLQIAKRLAALINDDPGMKAIMTRNTDHFVSLGGRVATV